MKKVSFIKGWHYDNSQVEFLPVQVIENHFTDDPMNIFDLICTESFTAEITTKIVSHE